MTKSILALVFGTVALHFFLTAAQAVPGRTIVLKSAGEYCLFLPRWSGQNIGDSEASAVAYCNKPISTAPNSRILSNYFIRNLHFVRNTHRHYVQLTGLFNRDIYHMNSNDGGGQYDTKAPHGAKCYGYPYFVELVEPDVQRYCLRCCQYKEDCPTNMSTEGCGTVIGGHYV
ncbi:hypothetical protein F5H01DRAFT_371805 [Linnemannia elongata]|nr:hypothetical protein F5H01DRAFT_371805 [Linnemannia elongata]